MPSRSNTKTRQRLRDRDGPNCCYCGRRTFEPPSSTFGRLRPHHATIEHLIPRSRGGTDALTNLRLACRICNEQRGDVIGYAP